MEESLSDLISEVAKEFHIKYISPEIQDDTYAIAHRYTTWIVLRFLESNVNAEGTRSNRSHGSSHEEV